MSTTKAEYHGDVNVGTEVFWIYNSWVILGFVVEASAIIHCDNQSAIQVIDNRVVHSKMKHVELHHHYLEIVNSREGYHMCLL